MAMRRALLISNARVLTMDAQRPEAQAIAAIGERIVAVGLESDANAALAGFDTERIDCRGRIALPGFIDAHAHVLAQAAALASVDCSGFLAPSIEAIVERIHARSIGAPTGSWLRARGYHEAVLVERRHPTRRDLDRATRDHPVRLIHASGHASVLNSAALASLCVDIATPEPPGGRIERDLRSGEPSGLLVEMEDWLEKVIPRPEEDELVANLSRVSEQFLAAGVTSVQDLGHRNNSARATFLAKLVESRRFRPRLDLATGYDAFAAGDTAAAGGIGGGPVKIMLNETGEHLWPGPEDLRDRVVAVHLAGRQLAIHATEQRSVEAALDAVEEAQRHYPRPGARHRIEHASVVPSGLARRMAAAGVTAVVNPAFLHEYGNRYLRTVPAVSLPFLYDSGGLARAGVRVAAGSDCPVGSLEPAVGIVAAMRRQTVSGEQIPGATLDLIQAIALYTSGAAWAGRCDDDRGRIAPSLLADLVICDHDDSASGPVLQVVMTVLGGEVVWQAGSCRF